MHILQPDQYLHYSLKQGSMSTGKLHRQWCQPGADLGFHFFKEGAPYSLVLLTSNQAIKMKQMHE